MKNNKNLPGTADYSENIELFPKEIEGIAEEFDPITMKWKTIGVHPLKLGPGGLNLLTKPKSIDAKGAALELSTSSFGEFKTHLPNIHLQLVEYLNSRYTNPQASKNAPQPTKYSEIRRDLETWAATKSVKQQGERDTSFQNFSNRTRWIADADEDLRNALQGLGSTTLTINNKAVVDDGIAKARRFDNKIKDERDIDEKIRTEMPEFERAYTNQLEAAERETQIVPSMEKVLWAMVLQHSDPSANNHSMSLVDIDVKWNKYITPPMSFGSFAAKGQELAQAIFNNTIKDLKLYIEKFIMKRRFGAEPEYFKPLNDEIQKDIEKMYWSVLDPFNPTLISEHVADRSKLFTYLSDKVDAFGDRIKEFNARIKIMEQASKLQIAPQKIIDKDPVTVPLTELLAQKMAINFEREKLALEKIKAAAPKTSGKEFKLKSDVIKKQIEDPTSAIKLMKFGPLAIEYWNATHPDNQIKDKSKGLQTVKTLLKNDDDAKMWLRWVQEKKAEKEFKEFGFMITE